MTTMTANRIEKQILLHAPRERVWQAISDSKEFGAWFQIKFKEPFRPGRKVKGQITRPGWEHVTAEFEIEKMEPERLLSYRWHPGAPDPETDYSKEPTTLVELTLEPLEQDTQLRLVESGFENIPAARRAEAVRRNDAGWAEQMTAIKKYVRENS